MVNEEEHPDISIICPCYNEEEVISCFLQEIIPIVERVARPYEIIFVNDGSQDNTLKEIISAKKKI